MILNQSIEVSSEDIFWYFFLIYFLCGHRFTVTSASTVIYGRSAIAVTGGCDRHGLAGYKLSRSSGRFYNILNSF